jgi:hypothetical protein
MTQRVNFDSAVQNDSPAELLYRCKLQTHPRPVDLPCSTYIPKRNITTSILSSHKIQKLTKLETHISPVQQQQTYQNEICLFCFALGVHPGMCSVIDFNLTRDDMMPFDTYIHLPTLCCFVLIVYINRLLPRSTTTTAVSPA